MILSQAAAPFVRCPQVECLEGGESGRGGR